MKYPTIGSMEAPKAAKIKGLDNGEIVPRKENSSFGFADIIAKGEGPNPPYSIGAAGIVRQPGLDPQQFNWGESTSGSRWSNWDE